MTIEQVIKKAIEGGFDNEYARTAIDGDPIVFDKCLPYIFMSSFFWQSLGEAMGWGETDRGFDLDAMSMGGVPITKETKDKKDWKHYWHRFIDHIAEGKSIEKFFEELK